MLHLFTSIFGRKPGHNPANQASSRPLSVQPCVEALEDRCVPAIALSNGTLFMDGAGQNDVGWTSPVPYNGVNYIRAYLIVGGALEDKWFKAVDVKQIQFRGFGGDDDFQNGTALPSFQYGGEGNDKLNGGFGYDVIYGEGGNDRLYDQSTTSRVNPWASPGSPRFDNYLFGGVGDDYLLGSSANDQLSGGAGNDTLGGGNGHDWLYGEAGQDNMNGGWGDDVLYGGDGNDTMTGFQGNDWLWGGAGADIVYGDAGADHFQYDPADLARDLRANEGDVWWG